MARSMSCLLYTSKRTACWAHIRRYLADAIPKGKALDYTQPSVQGMLYINQLFHLEDVIRSKYSSFDEMCIRDRDNLKEEIDLLRKKLFGTSSEKEPSIFQAS